VRRRLIAAGALSLMMVAATPARADDAHYDAPSSVCFRGWMQQPPDCWHDDTQKACHLD
jgi:hypothetical protein